MLGKNMQTWTLTGETYYNFKDGSYNVKYANKKSKDLHFTISTDYLGRLYMMDMRGML